MLYWSSFPTVVYRSCSPADVHVQFPTCCTGPVPQFMHMSHSPAFVHVHSLAVMHVWFLAVVHFQSFSCCTSLVPQLLYRFCTHTLSVYSEEHRYFLLANEYTDTFLFYLKKCLKLKSIEIEQTLFQKYIFF
jgi:hypothetical protein